jgi:hypothetical protein
MRRRPPWLGVLVAAPLLLGAADAPGDLVPCEGAGIVDGTAPIDILTAKGTTAEDGLALRFTLTFSEPVPLPDEEGSPLRVDVLLRDPTVPDLSVDYYRAVNRIVRFDAVNARAGLAILLLPERAESPFTSGVEVDGERLTLTLPSRMVMQDPDLAGFDYSGLRWTVVARDEDTCDLLGEAARPVHRVKVLDADPDPAPSPSRSVATAADDPLISIGFVAACLLAIVVGGAGGFAAARWRRRTG